MSHDVTLQYDSVFRPLCIVRGTGPKSLGVLQVKRSEAECVWVCVWVCVCVWMYVWMYVCVYPVTVIVTGCITGEAQ